MTNEQIIKALEYKKARIARLQCFLYAVQSCLSVALMFSSKYPANFYVAAILCVASLIGVWFFAYRPKP